MDETAVKKLKAEQEIQIARANDVLKTLDAYERKAKQKAEAESILREARDKAKDAEKGVEHITTDLIAVEAKLKDILGMGTPPPAVTPSPTVTPPPPPPVTAPQPKKPKNSGEDNSNASTGRNRSKTIQLVPKKSHTSSGKPRKLTKPQCKVYKTFAARLARFIETFLKMEEFGGRKVSKEASIGWHTGGYILCLLEEVDAPLRLVEHYGDKDTVYWRRTPLGDAVVEKCLTDPDSIAPITNALSTLLQRYEPPKFDRDDSMSKMYVEASKRMERHPLPEIPGNLEISFEAFDRSLKAVTIAAYNTRHVKAFACADCSCSYRFYSQLEAHATRVHKDRVSQIMAPYEKQPILPRTPAREKEARARE